MASASPARLLPSCTRCPSPRNRAPVASRYPLSPSAAQNTRPRGPPAFAPAVNDTFVPATRFNAAWLLLLTPFVWSSGIWFTFATSATAPPFSDTFSFPSTSNPTFESPAPAVIGVAGPALSTCHAPATVIAPCTVTLPENVAFPVNVLSPPTVSVPVLCTTAESSAAPAPVPHAPHFTPTAFVESATRHCPSAPTGTRASAVPNPHKSPFAVSGDVTPLPVPHDPHALPVPVDFRHCPFVP